MGTTTTNYNLYKPDVGEQNWGEEVNTSFDTIDTQIDANATSIITNAAAIALNTTHRSSDGSDHTFIDQDVTSGSAPTFTADNFSDGGSNAIITTTQETNFETAYTHSQGDGSDHADVATNSAHVATTHDYSYISGNDAATDVTASELEELTDGSSTALHTHAGLGTDEAVAVDSGATPGYLGAASNDGVLRTSAPLSYTDGGDFVTITLDSTASFDSTGTWQFARVEIDADTCYLDRDGSNNMTFTDAVTGTKTLAELASGGAAATRSTFTNASLSSGVLTITHTLGLSAPYTLDVTIFDNNGDKIVPDSLTGATNSIDVDLTSYGTLSGTWGYVYVA